MADSPADRWTSRALRRSIAVTAVPHRAGSSWARCAGMPEGLRVTFLSGMPRWPQRPMQRVTLPLERMGARIEGGEQAAADRPGFAKLGGIRSSSTSPPRPRSNRRSCSPGLATIAPVSVTEPIPSRNHSELMLAQFAMRAPRYRQALRGK